MFQFNSLDINRTSFKAHKHISCSSLSKLISLKSNNLNFLKFIETLRLREEKFFKDNYNNDHYKKIETCPICKNHDTKKIHDSYYLNEFRKFYRDVKFSAFHCECCDYIFSVWYE